MNFDKSLDSEVHFFPELGETRKRNHRRSTFGRIIHRLTKPRRREKNASNKGASRLGLKVKVVIGFLLLLIVFLLLSKVMISGLKRHHQLHKNEEEKVSNWTETTTTREPPLVSTTTSEAPTPAENISSADKLFTSVLPLIYEEPWDTEKAANDAARHLHRSGMNRHPNLSEFLVCVTTNKTHALNLEKAIQKTWLDEEEALKQKCPSCFQWDQASQGGEAKSFQDVKIRVLTVNSTPDAKVHVNQKSASLLFVKCLLAVKSEYFILESVNWHAAPMSSDENWIRINGTSLPRAVHMANLGLQTLSNNTALSLPSIVNLQQKKDGLDKVSVFKLRYYPSHNESPSYSVESGRLKEKLKTFVKEILDGNKTTKEIDEEAKLEEKSAPFDPLVESEEKPGSNESSTLFHCNAAPFYNLPHTVPRFMHESSLSSASEVRPDKLPMITVCEALIAANSGMEEGFTGSRLDFYREYCQEWQKLISPPYPVNKTVYPEEVDHLSSQCSYVWMKSMKWFSLAADKGMNTSTHGNLLEEFSEAVMNSSKSSPLLQQLATTNIWKTGPLSVSKSRAALRRRVESMSLLTALSFSRKENTTELEKDEALDVICIPSNETILDPSPAMYRTSWFSDLVMRQCLLFGDLCLHRGEKLDVALRQTFGFLSMKGSWAKGQYAVCFSKGYYYHFE